MLEFADRICTNETMLSNDVPILGVFWRGVRGGAFLQKSAPPAFFFPLASSLFLLLPSLLLRFFYAEPGVSVSIFEFTYFAFIPA